MPETNRDICRPVVPPPRGLPSCYRQTSLPMTQGVIAADLVQLGPGGTWVVAWVIWLLRRAAPAT